MDSCIFFKEIDEKSVILIGVYVDDMIICATNEALITIFKRKLSRRFSISESSELKYCLGVEISKVGEGILLSQTNFLKRTLKRFGMLECKSYPTPMQQRQQLTKEGESCQYDFPYREVVGSCMYSMIMTRPDLSFALGQLSRYLDSFKDTHVVAAKRMLRYLKGSMKKGIYFRRPKDFNGMFKLSAYVDADWAGSVDDSRSTSGFAIFLNDCLISWKSSKQTIVALSSAEAEYIALSSCIQELMWIYQLLQEFGLKIQKEIVVFEDNQACIKIANNTTSNVKTKHIRIRYHFVKDLVEEGVINMKWIASEWNLADLFTKALGPVRFNSLIPKLGFRSNEHEDEKECYKKVSVTSS
jgi:hypothetical protein